VINKDLRNWPEYNEKLDMRGWFYLSTDFVQNWSKELRTKGWIKVHIAVDVETRRPITFEITDERVADQEMVKPLLKDAKLKGSLMD
jgi:hypothetical protein